MRKTEHKALDLVGLQRCQRKTGIQDYLSAANDEKRTLYTAENLAWVQAHGWGNVLTSLWGLTEQIQSAETVELPNCSSTRNCSQLPKQLELQPTSSVASIYLPLVGREDAISKGANRPYAPRPVTVLEQPDTVAAPQATELPMPEHIRETYLSIQEVGSSDLATEM